MLFKETPIYIYSEIECDISQITKLYNSKSQSYIIILI